MSQSPDETPPSDDDAAAEKARTAAYEEYTDKHQHYNEIASLATNGVISAKSLAAVYGRISPFNSERRALESFGLAYERSSKDPNYPRGEVQLAEDHDVYHRPVPVAPALTSGPGTRCIVMELLSSK